MDLQGLSMEGDYTPDLLMHFVSEAFKESEGDVQAMLAQNEAEEEQRRAFWELFPASEPEPNSQAHAMFQTPPSSLPPSPARRPAQAPTPAPAPVVHHFIHRIAPIMPMAVSLEHYDMSVHVPYSFEDGAVVLPLTYA